MEFLKLYFSKINYERLEIEEPVNMQPSFDRNVKYFANSENKSIFKVVINQDVVINDFYKASVELTSIVEFEYKNENEKVLKLRNVFALMMPYIRSEVILLTSQPGIKPVEMPLVHIKDKDKELNKSNVFSCFVDDEE